MSPSVGFAQNQGKSCASQVYSDFPNTLSGCSSSLFWRSRSHFLRALRRVPSLRARRIAAIRQARRPSPMLRPSSPNPILPPCSLNQTLQPRRQTTTSAQAGPQIVCRGLRWRIIDVSVTAQSPFVGKRVIRPVVSERVRPAPCRPPQLVGPDEAMPLMGAHGQRAQDQLGAAPPALVPRPRLLGRVRP
jgi:hypothetical protein